MIICDSGLKKNRNLENTRCSDIIMILWDTPVQLKQKSWDENYVYLAFIEIFATWHCEEQGNLLRTLQIFISTDLYKGLVGKLELGKLNCVFKK